MFGVAGPVGPAALAAEGAEDGGTGRGYLQGKHSCHLPRRGVQEAPSEPFWAVHLL